MCWNQGRINAGFVNSSGHRLSQEPVMEFQTIPVIRIFDVDKAKAFYLEFLGMKLDWEHCFEPGFPIYMQV